MTIERQSEKTTGMYKLEYKEKISAEAEKLSTVLQKVGSAAYSEAKEEPKDGDAPASGETPSADEDKKTKENTRERELTSPLSS